MKIFGTLLGAIALICMVSMSQADDFGDLSDTIIESVQPKILQYLKEELNLIEDEVEGPLDEIQDNLKDYFTYDVVYYDNYWSDSDVDDIVEKCLLFAVQLNPVKWKLQSSGKRFVDAQLSEDAEDVYKVYEFCKAFTEYYEPEAMGDLFPDV